MTELYFEIYSTRLNFHETCIMQRPGSVAKCFEHCISAVDAVLAAGATLQLWISHSSLPSAVLSLLPVFMRLLSL